MCLQTFKRESQQINLTSRRTFELCPEALLIELTSYWRGVLPGFTCLHVLITADVDRCCWFLAIVVIIWQTYLQIVLRWRLAWNLPAWGVSCHNVNKQRHPVWLASLVTYSLLKKEQHIFKFEFFKFPPVSFFLYYSYVAPHSSIFQNVAERNLFDLKCQYFWTNRTLFISTSFHCSSWQFQATSVYFRVLLRCSPWKG